METQAETPRTAISAMFAQLVLIADRLVDEANALVVQLGDEESKPALWRADTRYAPEALGGATMALGAAANSFQTLRLLTFPTGWDGSPDSKLTATVTVNGTAGLLRQSCECAAVANWLLEPGSEQQLQERGFAFAWNDLRQHLAYARSIAVAPNVELLVAAQDAMIADGRELDLLVASNAQPRWRPRTPVADAAGLLREFTIPERYLAGMTPQQRLGIGVNGEWIYRYLSGMAHGLSWVHPAQEKEDGGRAMIFVTEPSYLHLALSADLAVRVIRQALQRLRDRVTSSP
jgi:hypothetical protein